MEQDKIEQALEFLAQGGLVGLPTETVYGLAAPIDRESSLEKIFALKERPFFDPLIVHVSSQEMAKSLCENWNEHCDILANAFWPGPLTLVLKKRSDKISNLITSGLETVGLRCPNHPLALALIEQGQMALAAPSANKFTKTSPTTAAHVSAIFDPKDVFVLDGGACQVGVESSIIKIDGEEITLLRKGMITPEQIKEVLKAAKKKFSFKLGVTKLETEMDAPGQFAIHYRPEWPVILTTNFKAQRDLPLIQKHFPHAQLDAITVRTLNSSAVVAARELYSLLRTPLESGQNLLVIEVAAGNLDQVEQERWQAIYDRLQKATTLDLRA